MSRIFLQKWRNIPTLEMMKSIKVLVFLLRDEFKQPISLFMNRADNNEKLKDTINE